MHDSGSALLKFEISRVARPHIRPVQRVQRVLEKVVAATVDLVIHPSRAIPRLPARIEVERALTLRIRYELGVVRGDRFLPAVRGYCETRASKRRAKGEAIIGCDEISVFERILRVAGP